MAEKVVIVLDLEKGDFDTPFNELIRKSDRVGKEVGQRTSRGFSKSFDTGKLTGGLLTVAKAAAAAGAAIGTIFTFKSIQLANQQEDAVKRLNTALQVAGDYSDAASQELQDLASDLQKSTRFADEAIISQIALAKSFGATNKQAGEIAKASADLAEALGIDLQSATRNVAKTLGGYAGELGETIPKLKELTQAQLQAGEGIKLLAQQFQGTAQKQVKTFGGSLTQLNNSVGDLLEQFGFLITKSPALIKTISEINKAVVVAIDIVKDFSESFNFTDSIIRPMLSIARVLTNFFVPAFEVAGNVVANFALTQVETYLQAQQAFQKFINFIGTGLSKIGFEETGQKLKDFRLVTEQEVAQASAAVKDGVENFLSTPLTDQINSRLDEINDYYTQIEIRANQSAERQAESGNRAKEQAKESAKTFGDFLTATGAEFNTQFTKTTEQAQKQIAATNKSVQQFARNTAAALKNGVGVAAGNAFASFGAALVNGENALEAFGKAFLKQIANVAVQQGTQFILQGTGYLFVPGFQTLGSQLIAAGAGLAAFGGALGAAVGGGGGGAVGGGGVGTQADIQTSSFSTDTETTSPDEVERRQEQTNVSLVIQGDVLDSEETGTRIAGILSTAFEKDGIVLNEGATA